MQADSARVRLFVRAALQANIARPRGRFSLLRLFATCFRGVVGDFVVSHTEFDFIISVLVTVGRLSSVSQLRSIWF
jgi:hypothetical protein